MKRPILETREFMGQDVRIAIIEKEPYFCAADVGKILDLSSVHRQTRGMVGGRHTVTIPTASGDQDVVFVNEPNLYRLVFKSRKENAEKFQEWVFSEVLPSIRKTGSYSIHPELRRESTKYRNELTEKWKESGIKTDEEYRFLTVEEYRALHFPNGLRKKDMDKKQILLLMALESMEALKLHFNPKEGYFECEQSIYRTAGAVRKQIE